VNDGDHRSPVLSSCVIFRAKDKIVLRRRGKIPAREITFNAAFLRHHAAALARIFSCSMRHNRINGFLTHINS
jgi:hypothetical protein